MPKKSLITAEDLYDFEVIKDMELSPDGQHIVYSLKKVDKKTEEKYSTLWIISTDGKTKYRLTTGKYHDTFPKWTYDGKYILFLSDRHDKKHKQSQLCWVPFTGGRIKRLTNMQGEFGDFDWSPDGRKLVFSFRKKDQELVDMEKDKRKKKLGLVYRHIDRIFYKEDGAGYVPKERWHIWMVDCVKLQPKQLTFGDYDEYEPYMIAGGKHILFTSNSSKDPDQDPDNISFFLLDVKTKKFKKLDLPLGPKFLPMPSPNGKYIAYYGQQGRGKWWQNISLWVAPLKNPKAARNVTGHYDIHVAADTIGDVSQLETMSPTWSPDSNRVYFQVTEHGHSCIKRVHIDMKRPLVETTIESHGNISSFNLDCHNKKLAYLFMHMKNPGQIRLFDLETCEDTQLITSNQKLLSNKDLGHFEEVKIKSASNYTVHGWILTPPSFDPKKKYPSILEIHGGPGVQYGNMFMHEFFYLAAQGYVIYFCNPRGSLGYGEKHTKAIWNNWGTVDYHDVMAFADYMSKKPYIDTKRMGVTGGSYGGYMTNWIITHTHKFAAAVSQRCVSNLLSMWSTSDFNWISEYEFGKQPPWENPENYWRMSPLKYVGFAKTPTLIIHSERDFRCAIEQGEQMFVALKRQGVDTEMVLFPNESHGLSRGGRTDRRIARLQHILRWFDKYLKK